MVAVGIAAYFWKRTEPIGEGPLVVALEGQPLTVDPVAVMDVHSSMVATAVHAPLAWISQDGSIEPMVAESMTVSPDAKQLHLVIKQDLTFWDSSPVRAQDVVYSLERYRRSSNLHRWILDRVKGVAEFDQKKTDRISGIRVSEPNVVIVDFETPEPDSALMISNLSVSVVKEGTGELPPKPFGLQVIGCGPYAPDGFEPGTFKCKLRSGGIDRPTQIVFRAVTDDQARLEGFRKEDFDVVRLRGPMVAEATEPGSKGLSPRASIGRGTVSTFAANELNYVIYNWESPKLAPIPKDLRRSVLLQMSASLDRAALAGRFLPGNLAEATASIAPPSAGVPALPALEPPPPGSPPHPTGLTLIAANDSGSRQLAVALQKQLADKGLAIETEFVDLGNLVQRLVKKDYDLMLFYIELQIPSRGPYAWCSFFDKNAPLSAFGEAREDTGTMLAEARGAGDVLERERRFRQAVAFIDGHQSTWVPLMSRMAVVLHDPTVTPWFDRNGTPINGLIRRQP